MLPSLCSMSLISPNFDVKSIIFSQFWPGAFSQIAVVDKHGDCLMGHLLFATKIVNMLKTVCFSFVTPAFPQKNLRLCFTNIFYSSALKKLGLYWIWVVLSFCPL